MNRWGATLAFLITLSARADEALVEAWDGAREIHQVQCARQTSASGQYAIAYGQVAFTNAAGELDVAHWKLREEAGLPEEQSPGLAVCRRLMQSPSKDR